MLSQHPVKVGGHSHFDSEDIMFLVPKEQDCTYSVKSTITVYIKNTWHLILAHMKFYIKQNIDGDICQCVQ